MQLLIHALDTHFFHQILICRQKYLHILIDLVDTQACDFIAVQNVWTELSKYSGDAEQVMSPWQPLLELLFWDPILRPNHCSSFEDRAPVDFIYGARS